MTKEEVFAEMMDKIYTFSILSTKYQNIPRVYGSGPALYMAEAHLLQHIGDHPGGITVTELSKISGKSKSAISQMISKLIAKGMVLKGKTADNRKNVIVTLTEQGTSVYQYHTWLDQRNYNNYQEKASEFTTFDMKKTSALFDILIAEFKKELL